MSDPIINQAGADLMKEVQESFDPGALVDVDVIKASMDAAVKNEMSDSSQRGRMAITLIRATVYVHEHLISRDDRIHFMRLIDEANHRLNEMTKQPAVVGKIRDAVQDSAELVGAEDKF